MMNILLVKGDRASFVGQQLQISGASLVNVDMEFPSSAVIPSN
jgi:hypothetical protein